MSRDGLSDLRFCVLQSKYMILELIRLSGLRSQCFLIIASFDYICTVFGKRFFSRHCRGRTILMGGKMLRQVIWILPSHLPFQTVRSHDFGKFLTICSQFCLPGKIIRLPQCVSQRECIWELECPAKMSGDHVRRQVPCPAGISGSGWILILRPSLRDPSASTLYHIPFHSVWFYYCYVPIQRSSSIPSPRTLSATTAH